MHQVTFASGMKGAGFTSQKMRSKENSKRETTNAAELEAGR
jgi:hypothetical protein